MREKKEKKETKYVARGKKDRESDNKEIQKNTIVTGKPNRYELIDLYFIED